MLGVHPVFGRTFSTAEDAPGARARVAIISHALWTRRFGADPGMVGRDVPLNGEPHTIIGVMPPRFSFPFREVEIWVPMAFTGEQLANRGGHYLWVVGRLAPTRTLAELNAELATLATRLARESPDTNRGVGMFAISLLDDYVGDLGTALVVLLCAVAVVLLITAANLANLLLARGAGRTREMAVRAAIGAGRGRLVRQIIVENLVLSILGAMGGVLVAAASFGVLGTLVPDALQDISVLRLDWRVLGFAVLVAVATGVFVGLVPARQLARTDLVIALKQAAPARARAGRHPLRHILVVVEIAGAMVLVVGATLMIQSFATLRAVDPGFQSEHLLTVRVPLPEAGYSTFARRTDFVDRVLARVRALPAVTSAGYTSALPLVWKGGTIGFWPEGTSRPDPSLSYDANNRVITPGYIETMRMTLAEGRVFDDRDAAHAGFVVIVNETMARQYWPQGRAIGRRLKLGAPSDPVPWRTVVGVLRDVRSMGLDQPPRAELYSRTRNRTATGCGPAIWCFGRMGIREPWPGPSEPRCGPSTRANRCRTCRPWTRSWTRKWSSAARRRGSSAPSQHWRSCWRASVSTACCRSSSASAPRRLASAWHSGRHKPRSCGWSWEMACGWRSPASSPALSGHGGQRGSWSACSTASGLTRRCSSPRWRCCCSVCRSSPSFCQPVAPAASIRCARYVRSRCRVHADSSRTH